MTEREYLLTRHRVAEEYEVAMKKVEAMFDSQLVSLDTVFLMNGGTPMALENFHGVNRSSDLTGRIIAVLPSCGQHFTADRVYQQLFATDPALAMILNRKSIYNALARLASEGRLIVVQQGRGRVPTVYAVHDEYDENDHETKRSVAVA